MTSRADAIKIFLDAYLTGGYEMYPLAGDASFRRYIRVRHASGAYMLMDAPPDKEDVRPFVSIASFLVSAGYSAPRLVAQDAGQGLLLLEDLGDDTFSRLLRQDASKETEYYQAAIGLLARWHCGGLDVRVCDIPLYDDAVLMREVRLLSDWYLPQLLDGRALQEAQESYVSCWEVLLRKIPLQQNQFVHRDYHADNLMWLPARIEGARVGLLDFQDALKGDAAYDVVSLLEDARRDVPATLVADMRRYYLAQTDVDAQRFDAAYALLAAQRNSKIVGIFTRLAARDGKLHYLDYLPRVWGYLEADITHPLLASLSAWFDRYVPKEQRIIRTIHKDAKTLGLVA